MTTEKNPKVGEPAALPTPEAIEAARRLLAAHAEPAPPRGILDQLKETQGLEAGHVLGSQQTATFGAWCRVKGIDALELSRRIRDDNVKVPEGGTGDGPVMTEQDFDRTVKFRIHNTFGPVSDPVKVVAHADPAAQAEYERQEALKGKGADRDAAEKARKV